MERLYVLLGWCMCCTVLRRRRHTKGFRTPKNLSGHFFRHVIDPEKRCFSRWRVPTEEVYERLADRFAGRRKHGELHECVVVSTKRPHKNGRRVRYDERTEELISIEPEGYIVTYFCPEPGTANNPFPTNLEYFRDTCRF